VLRLAISLRFVLLMASFGAAVGALVMFWVGGSRILAAALSIGVNQNAKAIIASVMGGRDAFLFGVVLVIFAYAIAFGFVFDLPAEARKSLPSWMRVNSVSELKDTLVEVILVYLVVDFATDWPEIDTELSWQMLVKPLSIFLIAGAFRLFAVSHPDARSVQER
jgi:uncharacterized membrane protein YqhA